MNYNNPKIAIIPRTVRSAHDCQNHFISADKIARLYGVDIKKCLVLREDANPARYTWPEWIILEPQMDGNYDLNEAFKRNARDFYHYQRKSQIKMNRAECFVSDF